MTASGNLQTVRNVILGFTQCQRQQLTGKRDALLDLADRRMCQPYIEFRLTEQHHLQQFPTLGLKIGKQSQTFERVERHCLSLVKAHHHAFLLCVRLEQKAVEQLQQLVLTDILRIANAKIVRDREQQSHRVEIWIWEIGGQKFLVVQGA